MKPEAGHWPIGPGLHRDRIAPIGPRVPRGLASESWPGEVTARGPEDGFAGGAERAGLRAGCPG